MFLHGIDKGQQFGPLSSGDGRVSDAPDGRAGSIIFQAAPVAAGAAFALPVNRHMPQFACCPARSLKNLAVENDAAANAGADRQVDQVFASATGSKQVFAQRRRVRIVLDVDGKLMWPVVLLKQIVHWEMLPQWHIG